MKLTGEHTFDAPRPLVWRALLDPAILAKTLPGCDRLEEVGDQTFKGKLNVKVGPVQGAFQGTVQLTDLEPESGYHLTLNGQGAPGFVKGTGSVRLADAEIGTVLAYDIDANVGGRIAGVGQRLLDSSAKVITRQALEGLERQVLALAEAESTGEAPADVEGPSQGELAAEVAKGVVADLVPPERWPVALAVVLVLLAILVFAFLRMSG